MGRANVYLPDDLEGRVKAAQIPVSEVCQRALLAAVEAAEGSHPFGDAVVAQFRRGWQAGVGWTEMASSEQLLTLLRDRLLAEIPPELLPRDLYSLTGEQALAWEAGFMEAARATVRVPVSLTKPTTAAEPSVAPKTDTDRDDADRDDADRHDADQHDADQHDSQPDERPAARLELGDGSGCQIGVTLDGDRVCFDPHAAVRAGKSPLFAVLGQADLRARLVLSVAQDAASRGTGVVLVDLSGQLASRAAGLGKNVRVVRRSAAALPQLDDLVQGAIGLGGLWETVASVSRGSGLAQLFSGSSGDARVEPGYVTVIDLSGGGQLGAALAAVQLLPQLAAKSSFPRLLHVDLPAGITVPGAFGSRLGRIVRTAREQNAAVGLSAENADTVAQLAGGGALLSTAVAFATSSPAEADRLRNLLGVDAPILLNPPGSSMVSGEQTWAVMRDLHGRLGQVRMEGW